MKQANTSENKQELAALCSTVRKLVDQSEYRQCESLIINAMCKYPHAPEPHNLIGVLLEKEGDHITAMKHFRAAWALDPTYIPARYNLEHFGTFFSKGKCAFDEMDCSEDEKQDLFKVEYDTHGVGRVVRRR